MISIGIAGQKRAGKDTIANVLVKHYAFVSIAPGDLIRERLSTLTDIPIELMTNEDTKEEYRKLQQDYGVAMREVFNDDFFWIRLVYKRARAQGIERLVIPSIRGEEDFVLGEQGNMWLVTRPGLVADENSGHIIESFGAKAEPKDYDHHFENAGTEAALAELVHEEMERRIEIGRSLSEGEASNG